MPLLLQPPTPLRQSVLHHSADARVRGNTHRRARAIRALLLLYFMITAITHTQAVESGMFAWTPAPLSLITANEFYNNRAVESRSLSRTPALIHYNACAVADIGRLRNRRTGACVDSAASARTSYIGCPAIRVSSESIFLRAVPS